MNATLFKLLRTIIIVFNCVLILSPSTVQADLNYYNKLLLDSVGHPEDAKKVEQFESALKNGANPNWAKFDRLSVGGSTVLSKHVFQLSISRSSDPKALAIGIRMINLLFEHGCKIQDKGILFFPISFGKHGIVKILLDNGASATSWDKAQLGTQLSPIEVALKHGHNSIVSLLESYGAIRTKNNRIIQIKFIQAARDSYTPITSIEDYLRAGAKINGVINGECALSNSLGSYGSDPGRVYKIVHYLLEKGANPNIEVKSSIFQLQVPILENAVYVSGNYEKVDNYEFYIKKILVELLERGAYVSEENEAGLTPLHVAAMFDNTTAAEVLLDYSAKVMSEDVNGKTPLDYAKSTAMIRLLKKHGAKEVK
jgi:ankyrin repeat protein